MSERELLTLLQRRVAQLEAFDEIGRAITSTLDIPKVLGVLMNEVRKLLQPKNWSMLLMDEDREELYFQIVVGEDAEKIKNIR